MLIDTFIDEGLFHHYFQPIFDVKHQEKIGYEVLLRSSVFPNPDYTFQAAKKAKRLYELDEKSIEKALDTYHTSSFVQQELTLFMNVFPSSIIHDEFEEVLCQLLENYRINREQIVLEISESELIEDPELFLDAIKSLKRQGFAIALDDVGKGYANFDMMIDLDPDYIKLDRLFSDHLDQSKKKQQLIRFFLQYCQKNDVTLILEGLETEAEFKTARALGVPHAQGYFLGKPAAIEKWQ